MRARLPHDEAKRLAVLQTYGLLDTPPDEALDEITALAAGICGTPIALVSLVDASRQWFMSRVGLEDTETHRDLAFCAHAILEPSRLLVVPDAAADPRFADNPLVTGPPGIRFYAGAPLVTAGQAAIGTLCVIDTVPRELSNEQAQALRTLSRLVITGMELRRQGMVLAKANAQLQELNRDLEVAKARAEEADHLKSAFLATMSHELRTPLNSIIGFTGILLQQLPGPLNDEQVKQLELVRGSGRHLLALINDVLDLSKIEAGEFELQQEEFDLAEALQRAVAMVRPQAAEKGLEIEARTEPGLGRARSDRRRVEQILLNLLNNAVKFTEAGRVSVTAEPVDRPATACRFRIADTGIGIRPEDLDKLFQPFRQLDTGLARKHEGTGLGLAICRRLADLLGGAVTAESTPGVGSTFTFTVPIAGADGR